MVFFQGKSNCLVNKNGRSEGDLMIGFNWDECGAMLNEAACRSVNVPIT